jgi:hypothetical protein
MSRGALFLILLVLLLAGGAYFLSSSAEEVPLTTIETDVGNDPAAN